MADIASIISQAMLVLNAAEKLVQVGIDVAPRIATAIEILQGNRTLSDEERAELISEQKKLESDIDAGVAADEAADGSSSS